jgi:hypothetical protein
MIQSTLTNASSQHPSKYLSLEEFGKLSMTGLLSKAFLFHSYNGNYLFTFDSKMR